jgi:hypothetical protein
MFAHNHPRPPGSRNVQAVTCRSADRWGWQRSSDEPKPARIFCAFLALLQAGLEMCVAKGAVEELNPGLRLFLLRKSMRPILVGPHCGSFPESAEEQPERACSVDAASDTTDGEEPAKLLKSV